MTPRDEDGNPLPYGVRLMLDGIRQSAEVSTTDHLRAVVAAWDDWTRDDAAITWEAAMTRAIDAARLHLAPTLTEDDPPPAPRCVPGAPFPQRGDEG